MTPPAHLRGRAPARPTLAESPTHATAWTSTTLGGTAFPRAVLLSLAVMGLVLSPPAAALAQQPAMHRLPVEVLDVVPPSAWVEGAPGEMTVQAGQCRSVGPDRLRRRIVDVAVQEWVFFGTPVLDRVNGARLLPPGIALDPARPIFEPTTRRPPALNEEESARVAATIAGYWAVTPEGPGIVRSQNDLWRARGVGVRWRAPWSAAFISWVMCEAGLESNDRFRRAIAHWSYIDQAIRARDGGAPDAAYAAYEVGERVVEPGDLLCSGRRPRYRSLAERRPQMGTGASSHCDIVVALDEQEGRILAIGGNVLRSVSLKVLPAAPGPDGGLVARSTREAPLFAHLELRADAIAAAALLSTPTLQALTCPTGGDLDLRTVLVLAEVEIDPPTCLGTGERAVGSTER